MYSPEFDPKKCHPAVPDRRAIPIIGGTDDFEVVLPKCTYPNRRTAGCDRVVKKECYRLTYFLVLCLFIGLSAFATLLTRSWFADEFSFVFKDKVTGRITRVEQKDQLCQSRRKGRIRYYHSTAKIEHYSYNVGGRNYRGESTSRWFKYKTGEDPRVPIYYDSNNPSDSRLFSVGWVVAKVCLGCILMWMFFSVCVATIRDLIAGRDDPVLQNKSQIWVALASIIMVCVALSV